MAQSPNVLLIYADDHRYTGVHGLGGMQVQTPNLDLLSERGVVFTHAYLQGSMSAATCMPSRHMLLTGRDLFQLEGSGFDIPASSTMIGEAFRDAGYRIYHVGKWHNDYPALRRSADTGAAVIGKPSLKDHFRTPYKDWDFTGEFPDDKAYLLYFSKTGALERRSVTEEDVVGPIGTERDGPHTSEVFADSAIKFIEQHNATQPFFMYLAFHAPHDPRQAPERYKALYPVDSIELPPSYMAQHPFDNGEMIVRDEQLAPWPRTEDVVRQELADYYAIISHMDAQIGRVLAALKASGKAENTIIVFAADSGLAVGSHGLMGKQNLYDEGGIHVPLIFAGSIPASAKRTEAFSYIHDVFPTLCELSGIEVPESVTGRSLAPVILGQTEQVREETYHAYKDLMRAYRKDNLKLIEYFRGKNKDGSQKGSRVTQLFDLSVDPWETTDLSFQKEYKASLIQMQSAMREAAIEMGDKLEFLGIEHFH